MGWREEKGSAYPLFKRLLDILFSALLLFFMWPILLLIGVLIRLTSPGPAVFRQMRVGRNGRLFVCYKFRTMRQDAPGNCPTALLPHAERYITPLGRLLRTSSLDELPQLWNILRGDMSLVGPRPLIPSEKQIHELRRANGVYRLRPGLTGLAQVNGRDRLGDEEKAGLDARYAQTVSFSSDVKILARTLLRVFTAKDISEGKQPDRL